MPTVLKLGGSLLDLPDLLPRLRAVLSGIDRPMLVVGGGAATDFLAGMDRLHGLGEEASHWLALHALTLHARMIAALLPGSAVASTPETCVDVWSAGGAALLDAHAFLAADEASADPLPHRWDVTTDSVAARAARRFAAGELILLKSADLPAGADAAEAARLGLVDPHFPAEAAAIARVTWINLRRDPPQPTALRR